MKILVYPQKYALTMSSTPGICMLAENEGAAGQAQNFADKGNIEYTPPAAAISRPRRDG